MLSISEKGPIHPQVNKRVGCSNYDSYESAAAAKVECLGTGLYSKVKVIARKGGNFDVACYVPLVN